LKQNTEDCRDLGRKLVPSCPSKPAAVVAIGPAFSRGQVLVLVALALVALMGFVALAVDIGFMWGARRRMQTAADAGAIAGAIASRQGYNVTLAAKDATSLNGFTDGTGGVTVTPTYPYSGGSCSANCVEVKIDQAQPTYFLRVLGFPLIDVKARAVAGTTKDSNDCMYALGPASPALKVTGNPTVNSSCGAVADTSAQCGGNFTFTAPIGVVGTQSGCPSSTVTGISPVADPFAYLGSSPPTCSGNSSQTINNGQTVTLSPGSYCNGITIHGGATVTFSSGTYNLGSSGLTITGGTITGTGVTFVSTGADSFTGSPTINLSAPTSDTNVTNGSGNSVNVKGILFWGTSSSASTISGTGTSTFDGALYFPNSELKYAGTSSGSGYTIIAADQVTITGTTTVGNNYTSIGGPLIQSSALYQ
jgi:hypothetical protein